MVPNWPPPPGNSWRWEGVLFYVRAGKRLTMTCAEVRVEFKTPPPVVFKEPTLTAGNYVRLRLSPQVAIAFGARVKRPGEKMVGPPLELSLVEGPEQGKGGEMDACEYEAGSWGPREAGGLVTDVGGWNTPE